MKYHTIKPSKELADYVQFFWVLEGESTSENPFTHRALADNCPELIFYYKGQFNIFFNSLKTEQTFLSGIYGQSDQFKTLETKADFGIFGVYLFPYALPLLFGLPANVLSNQRLDIQNLCGKKGKFLEEKMILASDNINRAKIISEFLIARLQKIINDYQGISNSIRQIITSKNLISIPSLAVKCNLSRRQFERKFVEYSGFSPKSYLNLVRFNSVITENSAKKKH